MQQKIAIVEAYIHFRTGKSVRILRDFDLLMPVNQALLDKAYNFVLVWSKENNATFKVL